MFKSSTVLASYRCQGGRTLNVAYIYARMTPGGKPTSAPRTPQLVLLGYEGQQYGLAQAISASGARYASLYGPTSADAGLEWWEHQGEGTLSRFTGRDFSATTPLLRGCKRA